MPPPLRPLALAVGLTGVVVAGGLLLTGPDTADEPAAAPSVSTTPLADFVSAERVVRREPFCAALATDAGTQLLADLLGAPPAAGTTYDNGQRAELAAGVTDVAHEHGCRWRTEDGSTAAAWVFAPPVTAERAGELARTAADRPRCTPVADAPPFGSPSAAVTCARGARTEASWHGLFGDAWLSCSLALPSATPDAELLDRAGRWCVAVAQVAAG